jgi:hypothetical protein
MLVAGAEDERSIDGMSDHGNTGLGAVAIRGVQRHGYGDDAGVEAGEESDDELGARCVDEDGSLACVAQEVEREVADAVVEFGEGQLGPDGLAVGEEGEGRDIRLPPGVVGEDLGEGEAAAGLVALPTLTGGDVRSAHAGSAAR